MSFTYLLFIIVFVSCFRCTIFPPVRCSPPPETRECTTSPRLRWTRGHKAFTTSLRLHKG